MALQCFASCFILLLGLGLLCLGLLTHTQSQRFSILFLFSVNFHKVSSISRPCLFLHLLAVSGITWLYPVLTAALWCIVQFCCDFIRLTTLPLQSVSMARIACTAPWAHHETNPEDSWEKRIEKPFFDLFWPPLWQKKPSLASNLASFFLSLSFSASKLWLNQFEWGQGDNQTWEGGTKASLYVVGGCCEVW